MEPTLTRRAVKVPLQIFIPVTFFSLQLGITRPLPKDEDSLKGELTNLPSHGDQHLIFVYSMTIHITPNLS